MSSIYFGCVDDTLAIFHHEAEADEFMTKLNCFYPSLKFTFAIVKDKCLPFLDFYVERTDIGFETSILVLKLSNQYLFFRHRHQETHFHWPVFMLEVLKPNKRKISVISTLGASSQND